MNAPILTLQSKSTPYQTIDTLSYIQTNNLSGTLPIAADENSDKLYFRIYNNWALAANIATAYNLYVTTFDGASAVSHTTAKLIISSCWVHFQEIGFGEGSQTPGGVSYFLGDDIPTGGSSNVMTPVMGSNGAYGSAQIRAGSTGSGLGFIEFTSYVSTPQSVPDQTFNFATTLTYDWNT